MLDLGSFLVSMGLQKEMQSVRKEIDGAEVFGQEAPVADSTNVFVDAVSSTLESVETAASAVVSSLTPSAGAVANVLDACAVSAPSVDLSLPACSTGKKQ